MVTISNNGYEKKFSEDRFNLTRGRRQNNTRCEKYNCGGFALGTFSWYAPYGDDIVDFAFNHGYITDYERDDILEEANEDHYDIEYRDYLEREEEYWEGKEYTDECPDYDSWRSITISELIEYYCRDYWANNTRFMFYFALTMLKEIKGLRYITDLSSLRENEYCVAFRVGRGDFHFIRSNNYKCEKWIGKMGQGRVRELVTSLQPGGEEFFDELFGTRYDSRTLLFAKAS